MKKEHLLHYFPFLKKEFRQIAKEEINSEETFKELFPNEVYDSSKLKAVYEYQNCKPFTYYVSEEQIKPAQSLKPKVKKNGKV